MKYFRCVLCVMATNKNNVKCPRGHEILTMVHCAVPALPDLSQHYNANLQLVKHFDDFCGFSVSSAPT